ncbi:MAG: hypothetical protein ACI8UO_000430 [Verrucomicrobiales bacterium]|jgi:hypothetical protein
MLTINSQNSGRFCDGHSRRNFLKIGGLSGLAAGGISLPQLLAAENETTGKLGHKAIINIFLPGGPPHQDMFDLKPDAPTDIRGEFQPISTNVDGIQICEEFPRMAKMMDKFTVIRSMVGSTGRHDADQCMTGRPFNQQPPGGWPSMGSVVSELAGAANPATPPFIGLSPKCGHDEWGDPGKAGFLGPSHAAFCPFRGGGKADMNLEGISLERLDDREQLLSSFDNFRRKVDSSRMMEGMDTFNQQAFGVLTSSKLAEALDVSKDEPYWVERYGKGSDVLRADGAWKRLDQFLMARRLVEAGARVVTLSFSRWDWHGGNFNRGREDFPMLDQGLSALVEDLHSKGLDKEVTVVCWGEFGRTPKINANAGRDHWPRVSMAVVAGGDLNHGQVVGSTTKDGGEALDRPVHFQEVFSTLYHSIGIDARRTTVTDHGGRPHYLVDPQYSPMRELVG